MAGPTEEMRRAFATFDTDGSGALSKAELATIFHMGQSLDVFSQEQALLMAEKLIMDFDRNGDGELQYEEFVVWWASKDGNMPASVLKQLSSKFSTKPRQRQTERSANRYTNAESLFSALEDGSVRLLKSSWIIEHAASGGILPRRQDLANEAFMGVPELRSIHEKSKAVVAKGSPIEFKPAPVVAVSHFWRSRDHPDPEGLTLHTVALRLNSLLTTRFSSGLTCRELGLRDFGVFLDFGSLYQKPRSELEDAAFDKALGMMDLWYAHSLTTKITITRAPDGVVPYHERGWCTFEYQLMQLLLPSTYTSLWNHLTHDEDRPAYASSRPTLAAPEAFFAGGKCGEKIFTNGADRELVAAKWRDTVTHILGHATELLFQNAGWGDAQMEELGQVLPLCSRLKSLMLRGNIFTALPPAIYSLNLLETLGLQECAQLVEVPGSLAKLPRLSLINCDGCAGLTTVPVALRKKRGLTLMLPRHLR